MKCKDCGNPVTVTIKAELLCFSCYDKRQRVQTRPHRIPCSCGKLKAQGAKCEYCKK